MPCNQGSSAATRHFSSEASPCGIEVQYGHWWRHHDKRKWCQSKSTVNQMGRLCNACSGQDLLGIHFGSISRKSNWHSGRNWQSTSDGQMHLEMVSEDGETETSEGFSIHAYCILLLEFLSVQNAMYIDSLHPFLSHFYPLQRMRFAPQ